MRGSEITADPYDFVAEAKSLDSISLTPPLTSAKMRTAAYKSACFN